MPLMRFPGGPGLRPALRVDSPPGPADTPANPPRKRVGSPLQGTPSAYARTTSNRMQCIRLVKKKGGRRDTTPASIGRSASQRAASSLYKALPQSLMPERLAPVSGPHRVPQDRARQKATADRSQTRAGEPAPATRAASVTLPNYISCYSPSELSDWQEIEA